jgi:hypothetical protein
VNGERIDWVCTPRKYSPMTKTLFKFRPAEELCLQQENPIVHSHLEINSNHTEKVDLLRCRLLALFAIGLVISFAHCLRGGSELQSFILIIGPVYFRGGANLSHATLSPHQENGKFPASVPTNYMAVGPPRYRDITVEIWMKPWTLPRSATSTQSFSFIFNIAWTRKTIPASSPHENSTTYLIYMISFNSIRMILLPSQLSAMYFTSTTFFTPPSPSSLLSPRELHRTQSRY